MHKRDEHVHVQYVNCELKLRQNRKKKFYLKARQENHTIWVGPLI